ncbi:MAG: ribosomal protein S18-alanine N-acetyltransferase [Bacilli bacterium]|nr:ribosomal protein S18-alanine N-acetyltransferase [Bacilli bacterium]
MNYLFRKMVKDDIASIVKGEIEAFGHSMGEDFFIQELEIDPFSEFIVLEIDGKIGGYFGLLIHDTIEIMNLYVKKEYQGLGFGNIMMDFIINLCIDAKAPALSLEVRESNNRAINLYKKFDLKDVARRKQYYDDGEDAILMVREFEVK